ncbi:MAG: hypothetical protein HOG61_04605, partial [Nitrospina sp.]|nr:hypothetical protein [Nitrospina sp.]
RLASISKYNNLKEKKSEEIKNLKTITASLRSELDKVETDKAKAIKATNQANTKAKDERLASISKYNNLKEKKTKEIQALKITTATLKSELNKIKTSKDNAIETAGQASAQIQTERLKNAKLLASLEIKNEKEISNLKEIFDLKIFITSLQSELKKTQVEKDVVSNAFDETSAELKTTNSDNIKFTNKLKDTVLFLRKELDNLKVESDKNKREEKIVNSNETDLIKEASRKKILALKNTVISLRSKLDKDKANKTNKLTTIDQDNIKENKKLNSTIKNLRTVLETFKNKKLKTDEATKALNLKLGAERILKDKEISALKKETIVLKLKLDKANLDRVKAIGRINQRIKKPTTGLIPKKEIIDQPSKKQGVVKSNRRLSATDINPTAIVTSNLYNWVKAWESRDTSLYLSFYSKNFKDPKRSLLKWKSYRRKSLKKSSNISIQISNIKTYLSNQNIIRINFIQRYKSNTASDVGKKSLVWEKGPDGWKIIKESWKPL